MCSPPGSKIEIANRSAEAHRSDALYERECILHRFVLSLSPELAPGFSSALPRPR
jgi:hypothetical protein